MLKKIAPKSHLKKRFIKDLALSPYPSLMDRGYEELWVQSFEVKFRTTDVGSFLEEVHKFVKVKKKSGYKLSALSEMERTRSSICWCQG